ncbi:SDR family NAD(P)-dependent oxidoreductase [Herbaspirillum rubrisubalbicans]|uniref:NAD(P)-dependent oxidoreductase n=1 Tax=Herbaspirillum rubrisubalbicans TaxID=80842 RepID=A0AAD0UB34_9BURK|nr:SDR family oxidoreductase [Herbaspirillum rubrisubalbicans]ALU91468.1 short-chain dehydrogenase/reductase SDR [Herbaspirillum rubrisubalbicans M1]AYR26489.1 NAD(P)-dependent oxidoreductase [Herbaspirillum rubrisubalbicans]
MGESHYLVVGGSKGTGLALVEHLLADGQRVSVLARSACALPPSPLLTWLPVDVTDTVALHTALDACVAGQGKIDSAVFMQRHRASDDAFETDLAVALTATRATIDHLVARKHFSGSAQGNGIVMVSSIADHYIAPEQDLGYHVSKAGLVQLARFYALQLGPLGLRVNVVSPCVVIKEAAQEYYRQNSWITDRFEHFIPLRRAGSSQDIINAILFLTGAQSSYITGQNIVVDGGLTLRSHESIIRDFPQH